LFAAISKRLGISITDLNHVPFNSTAFMPSTWNDGMLELWNNGQKRITSVFGSRHKEKPHLALRGVAFY
jgi:hypothetical protein